MSRQHVTEEIWGIKKRSRRCGKTIPPDTSCLGVQEDRLPASEDAVGVWTTASTTGNVRKGFEFGMDSSVASEAEVKGSESDKRGVEEGERKMRHGEIVVEKTVRTERETLVHARRRVRGQVSDEGEKD